MRLPTDTDLEDIVYGDMSLREYAAVHLKYPDSGNKKLDEFIRCALDSERDRTLSLTTELQRITMLNMADTMKEIGDGGH